MDEEDLADAAEAQSLETRQSFSGFGSTEDEVGHVKGFIDLLEPHEDTMGVRLMQKMGWRQGQGVGPRVWRNARSDDFDQATQVTGEKDAHLFAPDNPPMIRHLRKDDRKGLGFLTEDSLIPTAGDQWNEKDDGGIERGPSEGDPTRTHQARKSNNASNQESRKGAFGVGVLNDNGSDEDDPYDMGPRIAFNRTSGGNKKAKKKDGKKIGPASAANPLLGSKPVFRPQKLLQSRKRIRRCHDNRFPLQGFWLAESDLHSPSLIDVGSKYSPPKIPDDWQSSMTSNSDLLPEKKPYNSAAEAAKASKLDPKSRASLLGESQLPGKSVFDFLSPSARDRLATASGRSQLPSARGEKLPGETGHGRHGTQAKVAVPAVDKNLAQAALSRGKGGWMPYSDDPEKRARYTGFLELHAGLRDKPPDRPPLMKSGTFEEELKEFAHAAEVFKPMSGAMASRFTSSTTTTGAQSNDPSTDPSARIAKASETQKGNDPVEQAARMGMFGPMTRSEHRFFPNRLLCKRFNVKAPPHVLSSNEITESRKTGLAQEKASQPRLPSAHDTVKADGASETVQPGNQGAHTTNLDAMAGSQSSVLQALHGDAKVDANRNEALEGQKAGEAVFKAIFGSDDEDE